jgi:hypothetical protein
MKSPTFLPVPNPAAPPRGYVLAAAIEARGELVRYTNLDTCRVPLTMVAQRTAWRWCEAGRCGLHLDVHDVAFLAAAIVEILALDPVVLACLHQQGIVTPPGFRPFVPPKKWTGGQP